MRQSDEVTTAGTADCCDHDNKIVGFWGHRRARWAIGLTQQSENDAEMTGTFSEHCRLGRQGIAIQRTPQQ